MNKATISIYRQPKWEWFDFVGFSGPRNGNYATTYGWSRTGYAQATGINRSVGARLLRNDVVIETGVAFTDISINNQYLQFNTLTQNNDKVQLKYDPTYLQRFWYRYAGIDKILFDVNQSLELTEISLRRNNIAFGDWDLSNLSNLQVFEISNNASIGSLTLHPDAPILLYYISGTYVPQATMDYIILQAYNKGLPNGQILNSGIIPSDNVCDECDILVSRGWTIQTMPDCTVVETHWVGADPECEEEQIPPTMGELRHVESTYDTITVEWDAATDDKGITAYEVYAYNDFWGGTFLMGTVNANTLSFTMTDLEPGSYQIAVRAKDTDDLYSEFSNTVYTSTIFLGESLPSFSFNEDWSLDDEGALSGGHNGSKRYYTQSSIPSSGLWSVTNSGYGLRIDWENSDNCGGSNSNTQKGNAAVTVTASQEEPIYVNWRGMAERHDTGFENMSIYIDGVLIGEATSPGGNLGCEMGNIVSTNYYPDGYTLTAGEHEITITTTTGDGQYHLDAYYEFLFSKEPIQNF
jgi:hypothetical protein